MSAVEYRWMIPTLLVTDVDRTVEWLERALAAHCCTTPGAPTAFAIVELAPGRALHLRRAPSAHVRSNRVAGVWDVYVEVQGLDALEATCARARSSSRAAR